MKYLSYLFILLLSINVCFAEKKAEESTFVDPNDVGGGYIDPNDVGDGINSNGQNGGGGYVDPYDLPSVIEEAPRENPGTFERLNEGLMAGVKGYQHDASEYWQKWKAINLDAPAPPLEWSQVGTEIGAGYVGAFGGSIAGMFSGFLVGSIYDKVSSCEQCWVDVAVNMSTIGATLGASAGVYMFGNNKKQQGSAAATYAGTLIPLMVGAVAYRESRQLNRSGFYLATMPLMAAIGFNWTRHIRKEGEEPLFENFFEPDDMWVSKGRDEMLALNARWQF